MALATTLVLGIGNTILSDEGVGIHVIERLRSSVPENGADLTILDGGTLSFTLAQDISAHSRLIVVDAARLDAAPGTVQVFEGEEMDARLRGGLQSVHEVGLSDLMDIARLTDTLPSPRAIVGIQPQYIDWGDAPTPAVAAAIPKAVAVVQQIIARWDRGDKTTL